MDRELRLIIRAIEAFVEQSGHCRERFRVGITARPELRHQEHGSPPIWGHWRTVSVDFARAIEKLFIFSGMQGGVGGRTKGAYVYVYLEDQVGD